MITRYVRRFVPTIAVVWAIGAAACGSGDPEAPDDGDADVVVSATDQLRFEQANVTIEAGQTIRWRNTGVLLHTVTFDPARAANPANVQLPAGVQPFHSELPAGESFSHTFSTPGQYRYICVPHEGNGMQGTVTVLP